MSKLTVFGNLQLKVYLNKQNLHSSTGEMVNVKTVESLFFKILLAGERFNTLLWFTLAAPLVYCHNCFCLKQNINKKTTNEKEKKWELTEVRMWPKTTVKNCRQNPLKSVLENDPANLRLFEAFYKTKYKPTLNSREECSEFANSNDYFSTSRETLWTMTLASWTILFCSFPLSYLYLIVMHFT